jgi:acetyltransferase
MTSRGLGRTLMQKIIDYARARGIREVWGVALRENRAMRSLSQSLGFREGPYPDDSSLIRLSLPL